MIEGFPVFVQTSDAQDGVNGIEANPRLFTKHGAEIINTAGSIAARSKIGLVRLPHLIAAEINHLTFDLSGIRKEKVLLALKKYCGYSGTLRPWELSDDLIGADVESSLYKARDYAIQRGSSGGYIDGIDLLQGSFEQISDPTLRTILAFHDINVEEILQRAKLLSISPFVVKATVQY